MPGRWVARVTVAALAAAAASDGARAQPAAPGVPPPGPAETPSEPAGSGAAIAGSAATPATPAVPTPAPPVKDPKLAKKWLATAQQLMQRGSYFAARNRPDDARPQFENAVAAYQRAIDAGEDDNVYLDLASAEDRLGKPVEAVKHLRRLTAAGATARPDVIKKAGARLEEVLTKVGVVTLVVEPAGTAITLGGAELGTAPLPEPLVLMPGTYTLAFQAAGFQPKEAEIAVDPGTATERAIALEPVTVVFAPVAPPAILGPEPEHIDDRPRSPSTLPLYIGGGVTGAAALTATIFGALALSQHATFTAAGTSAVDREDARTNGKRFALVADVSFGTAVVAAGITAYWYFYRYRQPQKSEERRSPPRETKLEVVPWVQSRSGGATIAGWF